MSRQQVRLDPDNVEWVQLNNSDGLSLTGALNELLRTLRARPTRLIESPSGLVQRPVAQDGAAQRLSPKIAAGSPVGALPRRSGPAAVAEGGVVRRPQLPRRRPERPR